MKLISRTDAAAALWRDDGATALANLNVLVARSLLRRQDRDRWQQHAILRSYALGLQNADERDSLPEMHARYYLGAMAAADDAQIYYTMAADLPNLRHAFAWARKESLDIALRLLGNCADLLRSQNLGVEYLGWAEEVLLEARARGSQGDLGRALGSRGNALQAAATMVYGEDRGARLREALAAYDEALDLRRDVPLDYATTQNNRAVLLSDLARLAGRRPGRAAAPRPWPPTTKRWTCGGTCPWPTRRPRTTGLSC